MSRHLIFVGIGTLLAIGHGEASYAQATPAGQPQPTVSPDTATSAVPLAPTISDAAEPALPAKLITANYQIAKSTLPLTLPEGGEPKLAPSTVRLSLKALTPKATVHLTLAQPQALPSVTVQPRQKLTQKPVSESSDRIQRPTSLPMPSAVERSGAIAQKKPNRSVPGVTPRSATPLPPSLPPLTNPEPGMTSPNPTPTVQEAPKFPNFDPKAPTPTYLNPAPNPLNFPTKPEEVKLLGLQPLSLKQAQELAERNNRTLELAKLQLERSRAVLREAQAALFPTLSTQLDLNRSQSASGDLSARLAEISNEQQAANPSFFNSPQDTSNPPRTSLNGSIQLSYDVFTSGRRPAQIRAAEKQVRSNELVVEQNREQVRLDVATDYYNLQDADQQVLINQSAVRNSEQSLRDTVAQERAGLGTRFDVLRAQVQLANSQQLLVNSIASQKVRRRQLAQRLSLAETIDLYAADPVEPAGTWKLSLEESIVLAYKNRSELEGQLVQREIADQNRKIALSALGPTLSVSAQYDLLDVFEQPVRTASGYSFAAQARWTLFDGGAARARARQSEKDKELAEVRFADAKDQIRFAVEQAYATLQSNLANIGTATQAENQAGQSLYLARLRFQAGVGTQSDVINAETDLTRAQGNRVSAITGYNRSLAELQRAVSNVPTAVSTR